MNVLKYDNSGKQIGDFELPSSVFAVDINHNSIYEAIKSENLNRRSGNRSTKSRSQVSGGGRKPWSQKGSGNARQGSIRSPQWRGGGIVHGPKSAHFKSKISKKNKRNAIRSVFSLKANQSKIVIVEDLILNEFSTKTIYDLVKNIHSGTDFRKNCFIVSGEDIKIRNSMRNIKEITYMNSMRVSCLEIFYSHQVIISEKSMDDILNFWGKQI